MATGDATNIEGIILPQPATKIGPFTQSLNKHALRLGVIVAMTGIQLFFYLQSYLASPIFPGNWSSYQTSFFFYLMLDSLAIGLVAALPQVLSKQEYAAFRIQPNGVVGFTFQYVIFGALMWVLMLGFFALSQNQVAPVTNDTLRLQGFVFYGLFVGPSEELFFRVACPNYIGWVGSSVVLFAALHAIAYTVGGGALVPSTVLIQIAVVGMWGGFFWFLFNHFGYGASVAAHTIYDLSVAGIIAVGISIGTLSLVVFPL